MAVFDCDNTAPLCALCSWEKNWNTRKQNHPLPLKRLENATFRAQRASCFYEEVKGSSEARPESA